MQRAFSSRLGSILLGVLLLGGCSERAQRLEVPLPRPGVPVADWDEERVTCQRRIETALREPAEPGAPEFERQRVAILGRARGEAVVWVVAPAPTPEAELPEVARTALAAAPKVSLDGAAPSGREGEAEQASAAWRQRLDGLVRRLRGDKVALRAALLRQGYLYSDNPVEAFELVRGVTLELLFDEPKLWLERGSRRYAVELVGVGRQAEYRYASGDLAGRAAELLHGDRVAVDPAELEAPLARDLPALAHEVGFDRVRVEALRRDAIVAALRFGGREVRALLVAHGAALELGCLDAPAEQRRAVAAWQAEDAPRRRALRALRESVTAIVGEALPFDRPRTAKDHLEDGRLRPLWEWAYRRGDAGFMYDGEGYPVFDAAGRPNPPEVCVAFVLDSYERASGTWYRGKGDARERVVGGLDFNRLGIANRGGVIAFGSFAESHPEAFDFQRFGAAEHIEFRERGRYFRFLADRADEFAPGDVVAIQGVKRDGNIHQHAILIEDVDPVTGFAHALADQMKKPRRRTWEGIMAEAPRRALYYHVHPHADVLQKLDPGPRRSL
ncbi:MAG: hypothetical protein IT373_19225 [Polyangiaceae bacterium]|nr:hypothetical protein [Polyangiaceae bacterium]